MDERIRFVALALEDHRNFSSLCADFGISRQTGYRWFHRYHETRSFASLSDHSHKPNTSPEKTLDEIEERVLVLRKQNGWGAKKLQIKLQAMGIELSVSTINRILRRRGVMRRKNAHQPALQRFEREEPNELWQMDYKGRFKVNEGYCYPLSLDFAP
jgi:transposase